VSRQPTRRPADLANYDPELGSFLYFAGPDGLPPTGSGALDGMTVAVKDLIDVAGWPTTNGASIAPAQPAAVDAPIVAMLRERGASIVGKTALNEYAYGVTGYNPHHGWIVNPRDRSRTASGSSGGSAAAVAAGVADIGIGTDTSGSVRLPAACCGVYGFKAAHGAYPMDGVTPLAPSLDSLGFLTADLATLATVLDLSPDGGDVVVGELGVDLEVPPLPGEHWTIFRAEVWAVHGDRFTRDPAHYGRDVQRNLGLPIGDVEHARDVMAAWRERYAEATAGFDVVRGPVMDGAAPSIEAVGRDFDRGEGFVRARLLRHTPPANALGWPALACPTSAEAVQLMARPGDEAKLLAAAASVTR
jgi:aspartyl-tRNA(Asn)/glutamyl-tRNA(Gln) amidotransferase subunit A